MNIVDAVWEERNLGLKTAEVQMEKGDGPAELRQLEKLQQKYEYIVVKVLQGEAENQLTVQQKGFRFVEAMIHLTHRLKEYVLPPTYREIDRDVVCRRMELAEVGSIASRIDESIFTADRISQDPFFPEGLAAKRYQNWVGDLADQGAGLYELEYQGQPVGFFALKRRTRATFWGVLMAMYKDVPAAGLGIFLHIWQHRIARQEGATRIEGAVSSNNLDAARLSFEVGNNVSRIDHVFIWHKPGRA